MKLTTTKRGGHGYPKHLSFHNYKAASFPHFLPRRTPLLSFASPPLLYNLRSSKSTAPQGFLRFLPTNITPQPFPSKDNPTVMFSSKLFLLLPLLTLASSHDLPHLPRPFILEPIIEMKTQEDNDVQLRCMSWRVAVEANNVSPWKKVPDECADYVKDYITGKSYALDLEIVSNEAGLYAKTVQLTGDGQDVWVFDVDETLLSNLPYYAQHNYGLEVFDPIEFDKWVAKALAPAIGPSLRLYVEVLSLGFKVFLLTGRSEKQRSVTVENLMKAGYSTWDKLILRAPGDHGKLAAIYKSEKRSEMVKDGYRILGNSGDQWSDLLGSPMSTRSFKLPNPMYYIP